MNFILVTEVENDLVFLDILNIKHENQFQHKIFRNPTTTIIIIIPLELSPSHL